LRRKSESAAEPVQENRTSPLFGAEKGHLKKKGKDESKVPPPLPPRYFMFRDIEQGTENFSQANYLGDGAYGQSYRARMEVSGRRTTG
jgi:hypothetical protein